MEIGIRNILQHRNATGTFAIKMFPWSLDKANIIGLIHVIFSGTFNMLPHQKVLAEVKKIGQGLE